MSRPWHLIGQILESQFAVSADQIREALKVQEEKGGRLGEILVRLRAIKEAEALEALSLQFHLSHLPDLSPSEIDTSFLPKIPIGFAKRYEFIPIREENGRIKTAVANPLHLAALDDVRVLLGRDIQPVLVPAKAILSCINQVYDRASDTAQQVIEDLSAESLDLLASELEEPVDLLEATDEAPIIRLINSTLFQAVKDRASDIHIEPFERELEIRYRIDGVMYKILSPPKRFQSSIISRVKIMAGLDIAEKRLPQDGRIGIKIAGRDVDIRVSVIPTAHGERVVLRLLDKSTNLLDLEEIGLTTEARQTILQLIQMSHGIVLVTGPTGSGKTTTLYAGLNRINSPTKNIITIEDPIEYQLKGVGQMQVNPKIHLTFASGLRSILRQDPDVIMVGEIRDVETAEIAIHASLTGHLVFSTLHTNDTAGAITRLLDMGVEPFLVSSSVIAIIAQRLVRRLCLKCRKAYTPSPEELAKLGFKNPDTHLTFYRAQGCGDCMRTGFLGRTGIYEILIINDEIRHMILTKMDSNKIKNRAIQKGMRTLRDDGARKVINGTTSMEEILRVTQEERVMG